MNGFYKSVFHGMTVEAGLECNRLFLFEKRGLSKESCLNQTICKCLRIIFLVSFIISCKEKVHIPCFFKFVVID